MSVVEVVDYTDDPLRTFPTSELRPVIEGGAEVLDRILPGWPRAKPQGSGVMCHLAAALLAGSGLVCPGVCGRWLLL
jgi:hypothetical protein